MPPKKGPAPKKAPPAPKKPSAKKPPPPAPVDYNILSARTAKALAGEGERSREGRDKHLDDVALQNALKLIRAAALNHEHQLFLNGLGPASTQRLGGTLAAPPYSYDVTFVDPTLIFIKW